LFARASRSFALARNVPSIAMKPLGAAAVAHSDDKKYSASSLTAVPFVLSSYEVSSNM